MKIFVVGDLFDRQATWNIYYEILKIFINRLILLSEKETTIYHGIGFIQFENRLNFV